MAGVVDLHGLKLAGFVAWWFWLAAQGVFPIGSRNGPIVPINRAWSYWSSQRHARLVLREGTGAHGGR